MSDRRRGRATSRSVAVEVLARVEAGAYANLALPDALRRSGLAPRDRAFATDLVHGTVRMLRAVDHLLAPVVSRPLEVLDERVRAALRMGTYQLVSGVPPHAAVGETVDAAPDRARGFVNGVLRAVARSGPPWPWPEGDTVEAIAVRTSHPDWVVERLVTEFGAADAAALLALDNEPPAMTLRVNRRRSTPEAVAAELEAAGARVERGSVVGGALVVRGAGDPEALPAVREGRATPQDQGSQAVLDVLDPRPGERILDVAAAPGGKSTGAAERLDDRGLVVAADLNAARLRLVGDAARRLGLGSVVTVVADGRALPFAPVFDRVLVDAPCSGLGVLRRRPDARWRVREEEIEPLAARQRSLLGAAAEAVAPGGLLVYSVCTLTSEETRGVDEWAQAELGVFGAEPPPEGPWRRHGRGALLLPTDGGTDGMYVLALRRPPAGG